jgi:tetratricopeptide (TPR) repeat protein
LEGVDAAGRQTFEYHNVAGTIAAVVNQVAVAEAHMVEAARLQPTNALAQLNLAVLRLAATNDLDRAEARLSLRRISLNPTNDSVRVRALRELVTDALRFGDKTNALTFSDELVRRDKVSFGERILRLEVLHQAQSSEVKSALAAVQREAVEGTNSIGKIYQLAEWQMSRIPPREILAWMETLPPAVNTNQPVAIMVADCLATLSEWSTQQVRLASQNWLELDFVRHAYLSRALRSQNLAGAAKGEWELALKSATNQRQALMMLLRIVARWGWQSEGEEVLWAIYNLSPGDRGAFEALSQVLYRSGRTRSLMMIFGQELKRSPTNPDVKNNLALTALLLEASELEPHTLAKDVYAKDPTNPAFASTYALSLHLLGKHAEALKVMQGIPSTELEKPSMAGYYGVILKAVGEREAASRYLGRATNSIALPEERKLFEGARAGL